MNATKRELIYRVVPWRKKEDMGGKVTYGIVNYPDYTSGCAVTALVESEDNGYLNNIAIRMNQAYAMGVNSAPKPERTIQFDEKTWNMIQRIVDSANADTDRMGKIESDPLFKIVEKMAAGNPIAQAAFEKAKEDFQAMTVTPESILSPIIKEMYIEGVRNGRVNP